MLRRIVCLSNCDSEKLGLYRDAAALLQDAPPGAFPPREAAWLVTTCFNRGCQHAKFFRFTQASDFMRAAMDLLPFAPEMQVKQEVGFLPFKSPFLPHPELFISSTLCVWPRQHA